MDEACAIVCAKNLHQCLWLPATDSHERLRVTYSTTKNFADTTLPAVLFCAPMFATRAVALDVDKLTTECGVRVIFVDRSVLDAQFTNDEADFLADLAWEARLVSLWIYGSRSG